MRHALLIAVASALGLHAGPASAVMYKCTDASGKVQYQSEPCPTAAGESRLREPAPGPSGASDASAGAPKASSSYTWDEQRVASIKDACMRTQTAGARDIYAQAGGDPKKLTEADITAGAEKSCSCLTRRLTTSMSEGDFILNPEQHMRRVTFEARAAGDCKLEMPKR